MFILDDFQEAIGEANLINGWELNTEDENELEISKETLLAQKENARGFSTNSVQNLVSGTAVLHQAWNGDIVNVRNQVDDPELYKYETCNEGVPVGTDLMCIPATARSPGTAMLFMDWIIEPEHAARNVMWNGYPQPVEGGQQAFAELVEGGAVDRRRPRRAREQRARVPARQPRGAPALDPGLHGGQGRLEPMSAGGSGTGSSFPAGSGWCCCSRCRWASSSPSRSATSTTSAAPSTTRETRQLRRRVQPHLPAGAAALGPLRAGDDGPVPADRLPGRVLHRPLRRQVPERPHRAPGAAVLRQLPRSHLRVGRAAGRRGAGQQRDRRRRPAQTRGSR